MRGSCSKSDKLFFCQKQQIEDVQSDCGRLDGNIAEFRMCEATAVCRYRTATWKVRFKKMHTLKKQNCWKCRLFFMSRNIRDEMDKMFFVSSGPFW